MEKPEKETKYRNSRSMLDKISDYIPNALGGNVVDAKRKHKEGLEDIVKKPKYKESIKDTVKKPKTKKKSY